MTDREINEKLATAMGWTRRERGWVEPGMSTTHADPPDYFADDSASKSLIDLMLSLEWGGSYLWSKSWDSLTLLLTPYTGSKMKYREIRQTETVVGGDRNAAHRRATALAAARAVEASK